FTDWLKATLGFSLPIMANFAEIVRGAIQSIPPPQWQAAESLACNRLQLMRYIIFPQALKRMLPPWMGLFALLIVSTPLASILGVKDAVTLTRIALAAEQQHELLLPMYLYMLVWCFLLVSPISLWTLNFDRRFGLDK